MLLKATGNLKKQMHEADRQTVSFLAFPVLLLPISIKAEQGFELKQNMISSLQVETFGKQRRKIQRSESVIHNTLE